MKNVETLAHTLAHTCDTVPAELVVATHTIPDVGVVITLWDKSKVLELDGGGILDQRTLCEEGEFALADLLD